MAITQGTGLALATGIRPLLPPLFVGALARADIGVNFTGSDFAFLESVPFLAALLALTLLWTLVGSRAPVRERLRVLGALGVALGALVFGGSLAEQDYAPGPGLVAGAICALIGFLAAAGFLARAESRLAARGEAEPASFVTLYAEASALALAGLSILVPPVSVLALAVCLWALAQRRRRAARKYEGLRVLR